MDITCVEYLNTPSLYIYTSYLLSFSSALAWWSTLSFSLPRAVARPSVSEGYHSDTCFFVKGTQMMHNPHSSTKKFLTKMPASLMMKMLIKCMELLVPFQRSNFFYLKHNNKFKLVQIFAKPASYLHLSAASTLFFSHPNIIHYSQVMKLKKLAAQTQTTNIEEVMSSHNVLYPCLSYAYADVCPLLPQSWLVFLHFQTQIQTYSYCYV